MLAMSAVIRRRRCFQLAQRHYPEDVSRLRQVPGWESCKRIPVSLKANLPRTRAFGLIRQSSWIAKLTRRRGLSDSAYGASDEQIGL
jgi:hypothetical protein